MQRAPVGGSHEPTNQLPGMPGQPNAQQQRVVPGATHAIHHGSQGYVPPQHAQVGLPGSSDSRPLDQRVQHPSGAPQHGRAPVGGANQRGGLPGQPSRF